MRFNTRHPAIASAIICVVAIIGCANIPGALNATRLTNADAEPDQWMATGRTYWEQRFSPLTNINTDTVSELDLAWYADLDTDRAQEATPVMIDGVIYVSTAWSKVNAYNAVSGELLWAFDPEVPGDYAVNACCDTVNRGVAVWEGKVYVGTLYGELIALDAATGEVAWRIDTIEDRTRPYTITGAPRIVHGKVVIGNGGAEYGVRGYVTAYNAETGDQDWRFYTVPGDPENGFEDAAMEMAADTWKGEWWALGGGGTVWDGMAYDPELDLLYIGIGNGSPWNQALRSPGGGDNLFLSSIVALNPEDGSYVWHYQTTPGETWDFTATQPLIIADLTIDEQERRVIMQAPKNGFFYVLDAATGELISAENFVPISWATHVDMETGRPVEVAEARFDKTGEAVIVSPGPPGAHNWHPMTFSPETGLVYIPAVLNNAAYVGVSPEEFEVNPIGWNTGVDMAGAIIAYRQPNAPRFTNKGFLLAWDPVTQTEMWRAEPERGVTGGALSTAGGLVFQGAVMGEFAAFDAQTGEKLWSMDPQTGVVAAPSTFAIDGVQYVALLVGHGGFPPVPGRNGAPDVEQTNPESANNSRLLVFALGGDAELPTDMPTPVSVEQAAPPPPSTASPESIAAGTAVYAQHCSVCHGNRAVASGGFPDLRQSALLHSEKDWNDVVLGGVLADKGMVSFDVILKEGQSEAVLAYIIHEANQKQ